MRLLRSWSKSMRASLTRVMPDRYGRGSGERGRTKRAVEDDAVDEVVDVVADLLEDHAEDPLEDRVVALDKTFELVLVELRGALLVDGGALRVLHEIHGQQSPERAAGDEVRQVAPAAQLSDRRRLLGQERQDVRLLVRELERERAHLRAGRLLEQALRTAE